MVWQPEVEISDAMVVELVGTQFPGLAPVVARRLAAGWDNTVFLVNDHLAFRFPHRAAAVANLERELAALSLLPDDLPLAVPRPMFHGRPAPTYPWPFVGAPFLRGHEPAEGPVSDAARILLGAALGAFLRALHRPALAARATALPIDPTRRAEMPVRGRMATERFVELAELGTWRAPPEAHRVLADAARLPAAAPSALVHGDLHHRHLLVEDGRASGVIDWGDACRADPGIDLPLYWSLLTPDARRAFADAYGAIRPEALLRARTLALGLCATLAAYAHHESMPGLERESLDGLERTLVD